MKQSQDYVSYLLRLWRSGKGKEAIWHASLESPLTGERQGFASLQDLFAFLQAQANSAARQADEKNNSEKKETI